MGTFKYSIYVLVFGIGMHKANSNNAFNIEDAHSKGDLNTYNTSEKIGSNIGKTSDKILIDYLDDTIKNHINGSMILLEIPSEKYFEMNTTSIKYLTDNGYHGVYLSIQRPIYNVGNLFKQKDIDLKKIFFIDCANSDQKQNTDNSYKTLNVSLSIDVDKLGDLIFSNLKQIKSKKKFIFIDSISTLALYKSSSDIIRFSDFLLNIIKAKKEDNVTIVINVAEGLTLKEYVKDISDHADEVINIVRNIEKYTDDLIDANICN